MKHLSLLFLLFIALSSCSENEDPAQDQTVGDQPVFISLSTNSAKPGDIITINGEGFKRNSNYSVYFNEVISSIQDIESKFLKVKVPEKATSGDITLRYSDKVIKMGTITIVN